MKDKTANPSSHERRFIGTRRDDRLAVLLEEEAHHLQNVLRLRVGDPAVCVIPEEHKAYNAEITSITGKEVICMLKDEAPSSSENIVTHVLVATTKPALNELITEKLCELGVENILFYTADRSVGHEVSGNKLERLQKIAITATKQCGRASLSSIKFFDSLHKAANAVPTATTKVWASLCHPEALPQKIAKTTEGYALVVGPAGDFSPAEEQFLNETTWNPMYLGNIRLREETAAIAGVCALHTLNLAL